MDHNALFAKYLEELTEAITDQEHFSIEKTPLEEFRK